MGPAPETSDWLRSILYALPGISRPVGDRAEPAHPGDSRQESRVKTGPASDGGGNAGPPGRARSNRMERHPRPRHAAPVLRGRLTRLRTDRSPSGRAEIPAATERARSWHGPQRTVSAAVESNCSGAPSLVGGKGNHAGAGTVHQYAL